MFNLNSSVVSRAMHRSSLSLNRTRKLLCHPPRCPGTAVRSPNFVALMTRLRTSTCRTRSTPEHRRALGGPGGAPCPLRQTVPRRCPALLRRPVLRCAVLPSAPPLGGSRRARRRVGWSGTCVASRAALLSVRREVSPRKKEPPVHTHARHTHARALWHCAPAHIGVARTRLCAFSLRWRARARNCRRFGFSSGVACGRTSSEEAEDGEYHARAATINQEHVQPAGTSDLVLSRRRSTALHTHAAQRG